MIFSSFRLISLFAVCFNGFVCFFFQILPELIMLIVVRYDHEQKFDLIHDINYLVLKWGSPLRFGQMSHCD